MFLGFLSGLVVGIIATRVYQECRKPVPSEVQLRQQESIIMGLRDDIHALETVNEALRDQIAKLKAKKVTTRKPATTTKKPATKSVTKVADKKETK